MNKTQLAEKKAREAAEKKAASARKENGTFDDALRKSKGPGKRKRGKRN